MKEKGEYDIGDVAVIVLCFCASLYLLASFVKIAVQLAR